MTYRLSRHAEWQLGRRQIPRDWLHMLLETPEQRVIQPPDVEILQSRFTVDGKMYLLRAVVATDKHPPVVVTVYRTSNIDRYWRLE